MKNLNHNKSLGPCSIPVKILKNQANDLKQTLAFFIFRFSKELSQRHLKLQERPPFLKKKSPNSFQLPPYICVISF